MYYLVEYERLNSPDHAYFEIRGTPELGIDSQPVFDGFCRVVDGVLIFAHGQFDTFEAALAALQAIDRALEPAQPADYLQMSSETSAAFILDRITPHVRPYSSNGTIARLVADCEAEANKLRLTLDKTAFASAYDLRDSLALGV